MRFKVFLRRARRALTDPCHDVELLMLSTSKIWPDKFYLRILFWSKVGYLPNFKNPKTFNEKLQWLKLYNHKPEYSLMADKYAVKKLVANKIGDKYVVPCLAVWDNPEEVDISHLPNQFVIKPNFNSSGNKGVCKDKNSFQIDELKKLLKSQFKIGYYWDGRDKQYRDIEKKVFAEQFLDDGREGELQDYKFWCFDGKPQIMYITNKGENIYENFYDMEFNAILVDHGFPRRFPEYEKPKEFEEMKILATKLSQGMPFVRVDFFDIHGRVYFGEYTFFDWGGLRKFAGDWDKHLGKLIHLPIVQ